MTSLFPSSFAGRVEARPFASDALRGNPLGDPFERDVPVYLPPDAGSGPGADAPLPVVFLLAGFTGRGHSMLETHPWKGGVVRAYDRLVASGGCEPAILVMPDAFTRLGGSQYVNSSAVGQYRDYILELVEWVDATYPTDVGRRGVCGKSSGGFGALHLAMQSPGTFAAAASLSGDCHFEFGYAADFLNGVRGLEKYDRDPARFLAAFAEDPDLGGDGHAILNLLAMSACYSPNPDSALGFDLPVDLETGERIEDVWRRWLAFDPVVASETYTDALQALDYLYIEAGRRDEFHLQFSARILVRKLAELGIEHEYEEFDGGHFGPSRAPLVLPRMIAALRR